MHLALTITFGLVALVSIAFNFLLWNNKLPIPDRGSYIFRCPSRRKRLTLIKLIEHFDHYNKHPRYRADDPNGLIKRAIYPGGFILNTVDPVMEREMPPHGAALGIPCDNPAAAAQYAFTYLFHYGDKLARVFGPYEDGHVYIVSTDHLISGVLVFRSKLHKMKEPPPWDDLVEEVEVEQELHPE
jgi:hypothetical protein